MAGTLREPELCFAGLWAATTGPAHNPANAIFKCCGSAGSLPSLRHV